MPTIKEMNQFEKNTAAINKQRSVFNLHPTTITTLKAGDVVPLYVMDTIPGSTVKIDMSYILRMLTPAVPIMDLSYFDTYAFWISYQNLSKKYKIIINENGDQAEFAQMTGENKTGYWTDKHTYKWQKVSIKNLTDNEPMESFIAPQSVLNYLNIPVCKMGDPDCRNTITGENASNYPKTTGKYKVNLKYPCTLDCIWNEWFRNENVSAPSNISQTKLETTDENQWTLQDGWSDAKYPYRSNILGGYFESALPEPVKATSPVEFNLGISAPVELTARTYVKEGNTFIEDITTLEDSTAGVNIFNDNGNYATIGVTAKGTADLTEATALTIDDLRQAIAIQHMEEKLARSGSRYVEFLQAFYGVRPSSRELERPEYLGGQRDPINISQVVSVAQTSEADIGELGAYSYTGNINRHFVNKSFDEWGVLMIVATIRTKNKYFEGIPREWSKEDLTDLYIPELENIGDQAIYTKELDIFNGEEENTVFGYQERYGEYKNSVDTITGYATPDIDKVLGLYNFQTRFDGQPYLNEDFETQQYEKVAKTLLESKTLAQYMLNTQFEITLTAPMKKYSIPGLGSI